MAEHSAKFYLECIPENSFISIISIWIVITIVYIINGTMQGISNYFRFFISVFNMFTVATKR